MNKFKKISWIAIILIPSILYYSLSPWVQANELVQEQSSAKKNELAAKPKTTDALFGEKINELRELLDQPNIDSGRINKLKEEFQELDRKIMADFASTEADLIAKKVPADILARHKAFVAHYQNNIEDLKTWLEPFKGGLFGFNLFETRGADRDSAIKQLKSKLNQKWAHRDVNPFEKSEPGRKISDFHPRKPDQSVSIKPAYALAPSVASSQMLPNYAVQPGDFATCTETTLTPGIKELARQLEYDPVRIFEYIRNNIDYAPYYGSVKGAQETLDQKVGNDFDIASLLIALYHASGIPARYVYGVVQIPIESVKNWVGIEDADTAINFFASGGIPGVGILSGNVLTAYNMEHVWVEASVPVNNYRGTGVTKEGSVWVPLDASFKQYTETKALDLASAVPFDADGVITNIINTANTGDNGASIANINPLLLQTAMADYKLNLKNYLDANYPTAKVKDILGERKIKTEKMSVLPLSLPYQVVSVQREMNVLTDTDRQMVTITVFDTDPYTGEPTSTSTLRASMPDLSGKRINLNFSAATVNDEKLIYSFLPKPNNPVQELPKSIPAYLVKVKPEIWVDGVVKVVGAPITMGTEMDLTYDYSYPKPMNDPGEHTQLKVTAGCTYSIVWDTGSISAERYNKSLLAIKKNNLNIESRAFDKIAPESVYGETLNFIGLNYFRKVNLQDHALERTTGVKALKLSAAALVGVNMKTDSLFGEVRNIYAGGFMIDIKRDVYVVMGRDGDKAKAKQFNLSSGQYSSLYEGQNLVDILGGNAVSTVKILNEANRQGIRIYVMNKQNINSILPKLSYDSSQKQTLQSLVNSGREITIPERDVIIDSWTGTGYSALDPATGVGAYMIDGGLAGGEEAEAPVGGFVICLLALLAHGGLAFTELGEIAVGGSEGMLGPIGLAIALGIFIAKVSVAITEYNHGEISYEEFQNEMYMAALDLFLAVLIAVTVLVAFSGGLALPLAASIIGMCLFAMMVIMLLESVLLLLPNRSFYLARGVPPDKDRKTFFSFDPLLGLSGGYAL